MGEHHTFWPWFAMKTSVLTKQGKFYGQNPLGPTDQMRYRWVPVLEEDPHHIKMELTMSIMPKIYLCQLS